MRKINKKDFVPAKVSLRISPGEALASLRKLQGLSQNNLARRTGISQANISALESGRQQIGRDRALLLAKALKVHPAVILFPNYEVNYQAA